MQFIEVMLCACLAIFGVTAEAQAPRLPPKPAHRGFADANLSADASLRLTRKQALRSHTVHATRDRIDDVDDLQIQQEVETMIGRLKTLHDSEMTSEFAQELSAIEVALANKTTDKALMSEITEAHEDLCAELGFETHEFQDCDSFMRTACSQSNAKVSQNNCKLFFDAEAVAEERPKEEEKPKAGATDEAVALHAQTIVAPAAAPASAPSAASAPGPALFGGKALRQLPEQGFDGKLVEHKDFDTQTSDWHLEFGPKSGHRSFEQICADHPGNEWCRLHGYFPKTLQIKSSAFSSRPVLMFLTVGAVLVREMM